MESAVSGPSALLAPEMVKFAPNFCYCAVDPASRLRIGPGDALNWSGAIGRKLRQNARIGAGDAQNAVGPAERCPGNS